MNPPAGTDSEGDFLKRSITLIEVAAILALATSCRSPSPVAGGGTLRLKAGIGREDLSKLGPFACLPLDGTSSYMQRPLLPGKGMLRGAGQGAMCAVSGGDPGGLLFLPVTTIVGGAIGLVKGSSAKTSSRAVNTLSNALDNVDLPAGIARELASIVQDTGEVSQPVRVGPRTRAPMPGGEPLALDGVRTALVVGVGHVSLVDTEPLESAINPPLTLGCQWTAELRDMPGGDIVRSASGWYDHHQRKRLGAWAAHDARQLRKALETARKAIATQASWELLGVRSRASRKALLATSRPVPHVRVRFLAEDFKPPGDLLYIAPPRSDAAVEPETARERAELEEARTNLQRRLQEAITARDVFASTRLSPPAPEERRRCLQLACAISSFSRGNVTERWLVGFGAGMPWITIRGELTAVDTQQRVLVFEAKAQSNWLTTSLSKTATLQNNDQMELAKTVGELFRELGLGRLKVN